MDPQPSQFPRPGPELVLAEARLVNVVAGGVVLSGTAEELADRLGVSTRAMAAAVRELAEAGWIVVETDPHGRLSVRWERRSPAGQVPVAVERRRSRAE